MVPADHFVRAVNDQYYTYHAELYDKNTPDISYDAANAWKKIFSLLKQLRINQDEYTVVDIGSGTGFVAGQFLEHGVTFKRYLGIEPSQNMIEIAGKKIMDQRVSFQRIDVSNHDMLSRIFNQVKGKKIVTLNSVLHHIVWWEDFLLGIKELMDKGDILILCHEPNARFWENESLVELFDTIVRGKNRKKQILFYLNPINYINKLVTLTGIRKSSRRSLLNVMNDELFKTGIIKKGLPPEVVSAIIDYGVPLCWRNIPIKKELSEGYFSADKLQQGIFSDMRQLISFTYQHLAISPLLLPGKWKSAEKILNKQYPQDGAQFCLAVEKK